MIDVRSGFQHACMLEVHHGGARTDAVDARGTHLAPKHVERKNGEGQYSGRSWCLAELLRTKWLDLARQDFECLNRGSGKKPLLLR